jgi:hypothetical protein
MDPEIIKILVNAALALAAIIFGVKYKAGKAQAREVVSLAGAKTNQTIDLAKIILDAVENDNINPEEEKAIAGKIKGLLPPRQI